MLVLTRKIGQQIVLPGCGVTIDVIDAGKNQVRLGIAAPMDVAVHRREIWDRMRHPNESPPVENGQWKRSAAEAQGPADIEAADVSPATLDRRLAEWIVRRTGGRIGRLSVKSAGGRTVVSGSANSYYSRQLAQAAVNEIIDAYGSVFPREVEYDIDIVDRSVARPRSISSSADGTERVANTQ